MIVVMSRVLGQDPGGVVLVVDQDAVGALGADRAHEPLDVTVRAGGVRRRLDDRDVLAASKLVVNLASRSRMRKRNELS